MSVNPLLLAYDEPNLTQKVEAYAGPSALIVTGKGNRYDPAFRVAQDKGADVLTYVNAMDRPNSTSNPLELAAYMGDVSKVPLWGNGRVGWKGTMLTDLRVGSVWSNWFVEDFMVSLMHERKVSGAMVDGLGCRLWAAIAAWLTWSQAERAEWTAGNVDLARRLHERRMQINPDFLIVGNGIWIDPATKNDASIAEAYIDGVCIESPPLGAGPFHSAYVKRTFANIGHRRVLVIADNEADAKLWATRPGVTHVASINRALNQNYKVITPPVVPLTDLYGVEGRARIRRLEQQLADAQSGGDSAEATALRAQVNELMLERHELQGELALSKETSRLLGDRVDLLTTKIKTTATFVAEQAEGIE